MSPFEVFLLIIAAILLIVAGVFSALAANQISQISTYSGNLTLKNAQSWMIWSTVAAWVGVVFLILLLIIYLLVRSADDKAGVDFSSSGWVRFFIFIVFAFLLTSAIFATIGLVALNSDSGSSSGIGKTAYTNGLIATIVAYTGAVLALIAFFISFSNPGTAQTTTKTTNGQTTVVQKAPAQQAQSGEAGEAAEAGEAGEAGELAEAAEVAPLLV